MLHERQVSAYLDRISYSGSTAPNLEVLKALHMAHLLRVPFENLDIALGTKISLNAEHVLDKIINAARGGFCYELNYAFSQLLSALGFDLSLLAARVFNGKNFGPAFDHLLLLVRVDGQDWIADVGFGDCFRTPLLLGAVGEPELGVAYKTVVGEYQTYLLMQKKGNQEWQAQYQFSLQAYEIVDFETMCEYQQSSPDSHFTQKSVCSIATEDGRTSVSNGNLILTQHGERCEQRIQSAQGLREVFALHFQMTLAADVNIQKLLERPESASVGTISAA
jgi:N-hydroxyarylamine O-acetyltransferase